ncbi:MAG: cytochrome c biogenesis protein CcsA [Paludibacter sp.]|nr:cytochrome c biogenesis protein CcsA [Bacteroidales bacterium]MCM1068766.1 cytochrome c biogenesis protein CcsA [Prevotella sp.]MCM1354478.1 cytochrome c biogenesis protein CcsA [Bacteroides sp.]MCM1443281.1 cytochrome c biogenesis protein CcsA [Muribaculum sp.]MCM1481034.1 cytochrome c biogenesis protein CcsA [Paludibacter sp.]
MLFLSWATLLLTLVFAHRFSLLLPFGCLFSGMAMMVSVMGASNPQITLLMPVLQSPLLSLHVVIIMLAYALLAFIMLNGLSALILMLTKRDCAQQIQRLQNISQVLLYPATFCLTIGIFVGAVWANLSWGRYWGWDPKEVWALITLLVYALPLHTRSLSWLQKPLWFHTYMVLAFFCVLFTYFGVNFLLGGMHGYV